MWTGRPSRATWGRRSQMIKKRAFGFRSFDNFASPSCSAAAPFSYTRDPSHQIR
jgi:hypothetical protein